MKQTRRLPYNTVRYHTRDTNTTLVHVLSHRRLRNMFPTTYATFSHAITLNLARGAMVSAGSTPPCPRTARARRSSRRASLIRSAATRRRSRRPCPRCRQPPPAPCAAATSWGCTPRTPPSARRARRRRCPPAPSRRAMRCTARTPRSPPPERRRRRGRAPPRRFPRRSNRARTGRPLCLSSSSRGRESSCVKSSGPNECGSRSHSGKTRWLLRSPPTSPSGMMTRIEAAPRNSFMNCRQCPHGAAVVAIASSARSPARIAVTTANCSACMLAFKGSPGSSTFTPRYTRPRRPAPPRRRETCSSAEWPTSAPRERTRGGGSCASRPRRAASDDALGGNHEVVRRGGVRDGLEDERARVRGGAGSARSAAEALGRVEHPDSETRDDHRRCLARGGDGIRATDAIDIGDGGVHAPPSREPRLNRHARASVECAPRWRAREPRIRKFF